MIDQETTKTTTADITSIETTSTLSKRQQKKMKKKELWKVKKEETRELRREKRKERKERIRDLKAKGEYQSNRRRIPRTQTQSPIRIVIDCAFNDYMNQKEITSLSRQIARLYGVNRTAKVQSQLFCTSYNGVLKDTLEDRISEYKNWKNIQFTDSPVQELFESDKSSVIYLTADSDEVITQLEEDKVYVIGGIVDKNRHKSLCHGKAKEMEVKTGRLPIVEHVKLDGRAVLTVNHVFEILSEWLDRRDWEGALKAVIPERKFADGCTSRKMKKRAKDDGGTSSSSCDSETETEK